MRGVLAIAGLTVRDAVRSRFVLSLVAVLLLAVIGVPLSIRGDGTALGQVRIILSYALGIASIILSVATLWVSCGTISREVEGKQLRLVLVKPVTPSQVWLGKWLGVLALDAALLGLGGLTTYALLRWTLGAGGVAAEQRDTVDRTVLVARRRVVPQQAPLAVEARRRTKQLFDEGRVPAETNPAEVYAAVRQEVLVERCAVAPGAAREWRLAPPAAGAAPRVTLRYTVRATYRERQSVTGTWTLSAADGATILRQEVIDLPEGTHELELPPGCTADGGVLTARFENHQRDEATTVVFTAADPVELLIHEGGFEANLLRALLVMFSRLAMLAALGVALSSLFSFPVASFVAASLLIVCLIGHAFQADAETGFAGGEHGPRARPSAFQKAGEAAIGWIDAVAWPAVASSPIAALSDGILISWPSAVRTFILLALGYPCVLGGLSGWLLSRRELALPSR